MPPKSPHPSPRFELMELEKRIFAENKQAIKDATTVEDRHFKQYNKAYLSAVSGYQKIVSMDDVLAEVDAARVILVGDYHTLDQSQRSFVRLIRQYIQARKNRALTVALEAVQARFQRHLDAYLVGRIKSDEFIKKIGFRKHWFFDLWPNYEIIFDFLAYHHIPIQAIDADNRKPMSLKDRDVFMAAEIMKLVQKFPEEKILVLVGDLHLAPGHLPREIRKLAKSLKIDLPLLSIYQNSPNIYWQLTKKHRVEHAMIVKIRDGEYCRMHTPPIVVQQTYLNWLYHEEGAFDWVDAKASFLKLAERIASLIKLKLPPDFENIEVYTCGDLGFLKQIRQKRIFGKREFKVIERRVRESKSLFLPKARLVYIANVSIHHAAQEAARYLRFLFAGEAGRGMSLREVFYLGVIEDGVAFFGSKITNRKRKCAREKDYKNEIRFLESSGQSMSRRTELETAQLFLQHAKQVRKGDVFHTNRLAGIPDDVRLSLIKAIGHDFGDQLYYAFMEGRVTRRDMQRLFTGTFSEEPGTSALYLEFVKRLRGVKRPVQI